MSYQIRSETPSRRRKALLAAALCFSGFIGASIYNNASSSLPSISADNELLLRSSSSSLTYNNSPNRELSIPLPHGGCQVTYAHLSETPIPPTWQASFPGSGARMTFMLVEALTGIRTTDDYDSHDRGYERVVAVKTHYPVKDARRRFGGLDEQFFGGGASGGAGAGASGGRAMVILRNPINAVPSYFNLQYEHLHQLPNHSTRGPNEDWIKYRDHPEYGFSNQIASYETFVTYWMEKHQDRNNLLMVSYEDLTDNWIGPIVATRIAGFLGEVEGVNPIAPENVGCVWETIVNYKNVGGGSPPPDGGVGVDGVSEERKERLLVRTGNDDDNNKNDNEKVEKNVVRSYPVASDGDFSVASIRKRKRAIRKVKPSNNGRRKAQAVVEGVNGEKLFAGKTHADPSSLRVGPKVRPYTEDNLREMLAMFERLVQRYNHDEDFVRIIASYIETAKNTPPNEGL